MNLQNIIELSIPRDLHLYLKTYDLLIKSNIIFRLEGVLKEKIKIGKINPAFKFQ